MVAIKEIAFAQQTEVAKSITAAVKVGAEIIFLGEVQHAIHGQLAQIERQRHSLINQKLEEVIEKRLLAQEVKKRGITVEQLVKGEVDDKTPEILVAGR